MKTGEWPKKIVALVIAGELIFSPFLVLAQALDLNLNPPTSNNILDPNYDFLNPPSTNQPFDPNIHFDNQNTGQQSGEQASAQRSQKDQQAYQQDAQKIQQLQQQDEQECDKGGAGGLGGANPLEQVMNQGGKEVINDTVNKVVQDSAKQAVEKTIKEEVPKVIKESVQTELPKYLKAQLPNQLQSRFLAEKALGTNLADKDVVGAILKQEIQKSITSGIPVVIQDALKNKLPQAITLSLNQNLMASISAGISEKLPQAFADKLPSIINSGLGDQINSSLHSSLVNTQGISSATVNSIGNNLTDGITQSINQTLNASMDQLTNGITDALAGSMDQIVGTITNQINGSLDQITGTVMNSLNNSINQITGSITNSLNNSINQITDSIMGPLNQSLNQITDSITKPLTDSISKITDSITKPLTDSISKITDSITKPLTDSISKITDKITAPLNDMMTKFSDTITKPFTDMASKFTDSITGKVNDLAGNAVSNATGAAVDTATGAATDAATGAAKDAATGAAEGAVQDTVGQEGANLAGGAVKDALGLGFVPVKEQNGPLMTAAKNTDKNTKAIWDLNKKICMYTKAIKRIQQAFEKQQFVDNPDVRRTASTKIEGFRNQLKDFSDKGYDSTGNGPDSPIYPKNADQYFADISKEQSGLVQDDIKNSKSVYKDEIAKSLEQADNYGLSDLLSSTLTKDQINKLERHPDQLSAKDGYSYLLQSTMPSNDPNMSSLIAANYQRNSQSQAINNAQQDLIANNGFLPVRTCAQKQGNYCAKWVVTTPGTIVRQTMGDSMQARLNEYIQAKEYGDIGNGNEPTAAEVQNFAPANTGGGGGGGSNAGSGGAGSALDLSRLLGGAGTGGTGGTGGIDINNLINQLGGGNLGGDLGGLLGGVSVKISLDTSGAKPKVTWTGTQAVLCRTDNYWYSQGTDGNLSLVKNTGETLSSTGSVTINTPISFPVTLEITQGANIYNLASSTSLSGNLKNIAFNLAADSVYHPQIGDQVKLSAFGQSLNYTAKVASAADIISGLQSAANALTTGSPEKKAFDNLTLNFYSNLGKISTTPKISYQIKCTGALGKQATGSVSLQ